MKKKLLLFLIAATIITNYCISQNVSLQWVKPIGTSGSDGSQSKMYSDANRNLYITIYAQTGADLDPGPGTVLVSHFGAYLVKYNAEGSFIWYMETSGISAVDKNGNIYMSGWFDSNYDFDPGPGVTNINSPYYDLCIAKYSTDRNFLWVSDIRGADANTFAEISGFVADNEGNCYINGFIDGSIDFDPSSNTATLQGIASNNYYAAAYDVNGGYKWAFKIDVINPTYEAATIAFGNNSMYLFGKVSSTTDLDPGAGINNVTGNGVGGNAFIATYDKIDGSFTWGFGYASNNYSNRTSMLSVDSLNNIVVTGFYSGPIDLDPGPGDATIPGAGLFLAKYTKEGSYLWGNPLSPPGFNSFNAFSMTIDPQNNILLPGADYRADSFNVAVVKYNPNGTLTWSLKLNHYGGHDFASGLVSDGSGNFYIAGAFDGMLDFDPGTGVNNATSMGMQDAFFAKYTDNTSTLPVTFLRFSGETRGKQNLLHWATAMEQNNTGCEVQRSITGNNFSRIGFVNTKAPDGNSTANLDYDFIDNGYSATTNYYRLKQIDKDGRFSYSNIIVLRNSNSVSGFTVIYPNPAQDVINARITNAGNTTITLLITDLTGRTLLTKNTQVGHGESIVQLTVAQLSPGTYFLKIISADGKENAVNKFVKK